MKMIISGKNIDVTPGLRSAVEAKLGKLERYFTADTEIYVTLSVEKDRQKIEVTIPMKGNIIRSEQTSSDMYVSIDLVEEIIERQLRRRLQASSLITWKRRKKRRKRLESSEPRSLTSNRCIRKMPAYRWSF